MGRSVLLQLARDSIQEVLQAEVTIKRDALIKQHPLLTQKIATTLNLFIQGKLRGTSSTNASDIALIDSIIFNAKKAAFQDHDFTPLTTSEYLSCEIEIILDTPDGTISEKDPAILKTTSYSLESEL